VNFLSFTPAEWRALGLLALLLTVGGTIHVLKLWHPAMAPGYRLVAQAPIPETVPSQPAAAKKLNTGVDPSTAASEDLELLPGIGPEMASRIIRYREQHGRFRSPSDLLQVPGIGARTLARISPYLSFP
jgi:competence ComEA-like helix-hairpin-helix protein